ncbi:MAG: flagellar M-ring protein FliF, partial [Lachnospiraceae bacterium]|nr:flagellar M-ring protein FliF [Lachnospiraceae bacterium]
MADRLRELLRRIQEWWGKFSARQKAIIVTAAVMAVIGIAVLVAVLTRDTYVIIHLSDSAAEASNVKSLFDENNITYKMSDNGLTFSVLEEQQAEASLLLGANDIQAETSSIDNVTNSSLSTTDA